MTGVQTCALPILYEFLNEIGFEKKVYHIPHSIADDYRIESRIYNKPYSLVFAGKENPVLREFADRYAEENPDFVYVYRVRKGDNVFNYHTNKGEYLGNVNTREKYMDLLRQAKAAVYSTSGMDSDEERANTFSQVTPKFLEILAAQCHLVARYHENADTRYYQLPLFSPNIMTYEQFKERMEYCMANDIDFDFYRAYMQHHYTSVRAHQLRAILHEEEMD